MAAFATLRRVDDPRDNLEKATRPELAKFAAAHGVKEITPSMPAILMRDKLRRLGLINIQIPPRPLGQPVSHGSVIAAKTAPENVVTNDAVSDLEKQWQSEQQEKTGYETWTRAEMAKECKRRGIKMQRTDSKEQLRERLEQDTT